QARFERRLARVEGEVPKPPPLNVPEESKIQPRVMVRAPDPAPGRSWQTSIAALAIALLMVVVGAIWFARQPSPVAVASASPSQSAESTASPGLTPSAGPAHSPSWLSDLGPVDQAMRSLNIEEYVHQHLSADGCTVDTKGPA